MALRDAGAVSRLPHPVSRRPAESAPHPIGPITLGAKRTGKRSAGNPHAGFDVAGTGDGPTANLNGHEAGNGGHSQGEPTGYRASPRPYQGLLGGGTALNRSLAGVVSIEKNGSGGP